MNSSSRHGSRARTILDHLDQLRRYNAQAQPTLQQRPLPPAPAAAAPASSKAPSCSHAATCRSAVGGSAPTASCAAVAGSTSLLMPAPVVDLEDLVRGPARHCRC